MSKNIPATRLWHALVSVQFIASIVALAMLVLGILAGATGIARNFAALMETQVRQQLWLALFVNPLAWVCLISALATAAIVASLMGCLVLLLHRARK